MADDMEFVGDAVAAMHVAGDAGDIERLAAIVALQQQIASGGSRPSSNRRPTRSAA